MMRDILLGMGWAVAVVLLLFLIFQSAISAQIGFGMLRADFESKQQQMVVFIQQMEQRIIRLERSVPPPSAQ